MESRAARPQVRSERLRGRKDSFYRKERKRLSESRSRRGLALALNPALERARTAPMRLPGPDEPWVALPAKAFQRPSLAPANAAYGAAPEDPLDQWQARSKNRVGGALSKGSRSRTARPAAFRSSASAVGSAGICHPAAGPTCGDYMRFSLDHAATDACKYSRRPRVERSAKESVDLVCAVLRLQC